MAKQYSIIFNDPNYDLVISETIGSKVFSETESFATQELAEEALTAIKTNYEAEVIKLNSIITNLNTEITTINVELGI